MSENKVFCDNFLSENIKSHPNKYLKEHIEEIKDLFNHLLDYYNLRSEVDENILKIFDYLIEYHDIGKSCKRFQDYINQKDKSKFSGSHSLWSIQYLKEKRIIRKILNNFNDDEKVLFLLITLYLIYKHHSSLSLDFNNNAKEIFKEIIEELLNYKDINIGNFIEELKEQYLLPITKDKIKSIFDFIFNKYYNKFGMKNMVLLGDLYGIFKISDAISANSRNIDEFNEIKKNILRKAKDLINEEKIRNLIGKDIDNDRFTFQRGLSSHNFLILRAPTGWGKTTTSLLFGLNKDYNRIFITLPTITSIEKFYEKLEKNFGEDNVNMYFYLYDAYISYKSLNENEQANINERIGTLIYAENLYSPINITTIDQILLSFLQTGKYFLKRVNLRNSILILDEIHLLTPKMLFILTKMIKHLVPLYNMRLLFMSATIPKGMVDYLNSISDDIKFQYIDIYKKEKKYYDRERFEIEMFDKDILDDLERIIEENKKGKSVLVIANTVEKAAAIYYKLKKEYEYKNLLLLHSRFLFKDRLKKEEFIDSINNEKGIFISTQVSEVSLDIDFDVLFTELAPISSIIQRAGRVNRYNKKEKAKIYVYYPKELKGGDEDENIKHYPYDREEINKAKKILEEIKNFREGEIIEKIDNILNIEYYNELFEKNEEIKEFREIYEELFEKNSIRYRYWFFSTFSKEREEDIRKLLDFRDSVTSLVILGENLILDERLKSEINDLLKKYENLREIGADYSDWKSFIANVKSYTIPIPIWILVKMGENINRKIGFPIIDEIPDNYRYCYFSDLGFISIDRMISKYGIDLSECTESNIL